MNYKTQATLIKNELDSGLHNLSERYRLLREEDINAKVFKGSYILYHSTEQGKYKYLMKRKISEEKSHKKEYNL